MRRGSGEAGKRGSRTAKELLTIGLFLASTSTGLAAQQASPPPRLPASPPESLTIYLMTMGPGKRVWERFGHNAIWVHDPVAGTDKAYNYGLFDLGQKNFVLRFLQGRMWYWMQGFPAPSYVEHYRKANRSVWIQELEIAPSARRELQEFLEWNERPENRFYHYDYYLDNCSTRIRDALDRALGGRIRESTSALPTGKTYRFHTQRLTANDPLVYTGLLLALGQPVDRPITAWEEMFLPLALREHVRNITVQADGVEKPLVRSERTLFESTDILPPERPPFWVPIYLGVGVMIGAAAFGLGRAARAGRPARAGFGAVAGGWALLVGTAGLLLVGLWGLTDHTAAYRNENVLQASFLVLPLLWWVPKAFYGPKHGRRAQMLAIALVGFSALGVLLKLHPEFFQVNGEIIALALPAHLGVAAGIQQLRRR